MVAGRPACAVCPLPPVPDPVVAAVACVVASAVRAVALADPMTAPNPDPEYVRNATFVVRVVLMAYRQGYLDCAQDTMRAAHDKARPIKETYDKLCEPA